MSTHIAEYKIPADRFFVTADTHYSHLNMCRGTSEWPPEETRDFDTIDQMNEALIDNINAVVPWDGVLFHLGDWSFNGKDKIGEFRRRLNVQMIHLVLGNHDHHLKKSTDQWHHFTSVNRYLEVAVEGQEIVLFHYGMRVWNASHKGSWLLYGHSHGSLPPQGLSMDVGVDTHNYRPYSFVELKAEMATRKVAITDHHGVREKVT
jgi:calcineurin-like phosphoesterase family protein